MKTFVLRVVLFAGLGLFIVGSALVILDYEYLGRWSWVVGLIVVYTSLGSLYQRFHYPEKK